MIRSLLTTFILTFTVATSQAQITLEEYCARVMAYSHELLDRELAMQGVREGELAARRDYLPMLSLARELNIEARSPEVGRRWGWLTRLEVSQPIFRGGAVRAEVKQAELQSDIAELDVESVRLLVRYTSVVAYWSLSRAENYLDAMVQYVDIVRSLRGVVAERYGEGYISKGDLLQVESRLSDAEYQLSEAQQGRDIALHGFNVLCGAEPSVAVTLAESILDQEAMPMREEIGEVVARNPEYRAALKGAERALWGERAVRAKYLPQIEVVGYGLLQPNTPHVKGGGMRADGGVMVSFTTPLYHFGQRKHAVAEARSGYLRSVNESEGVADRIRLEESDAWSNLSATHDRVQTLRHNLAIAQENLVISTYSYREGLSTVLDVLQAQISWLQAYSNAIAAQYDYAVAIAAYEYVVSKWC